ncbi:MAG TPA: ribonucleotide-diphosphate reductase subunit beta [Baekduia sp.]|uniref:ribonucleotide-diphosphate reductase subunit beta n=1 Tax=Baekduia sp. TaxID=2600305 RepID=UPI002D788383|nr:ribonucleotide-diphosphate reductase subunit beta [Baekduia sp.]HET6506687.1 ribonucleotide-diphosphate reductase subunit beta [Baekduia sp.]
MANLLELTSQGDVATISDESKLSKVVLMTPQQLYELWERQPWSSHTIDFARDREDWAALSDEDKDHIVWFLSSFFIGEERVATQFNGLVGAYETQSEEHFLTTQQVDEARHAQHFNNFYREVIGHDGTFEERLAHAREDLNDAFKVLFDDVLVSANQRLLADPTDLEAKVDFVTTYHMVIEGTLALTGQDTLTRVFEERGILPGFLEGFRKISQDEHRHVAFGTWFLQQKARQDPALARRIQQTLAELIPIAAGVLTPRGYDVGDAYEILGVRSDEVHGFAFQALTRRLKVIGVSLAPDPEPEPSTVS